MVDISLLMILQNMNTKNPKNEVTMETNTKEKKWNIIDWLIFIAEIILPVVAILCAIFIQKDNYNIDARLATIVAGITGQIVLVGVQLKKINTSMNKNKEYINKIQESICFTNEMTSILSGGEERRIEFARRRLKEIEDIFKTVSKEKDSGLLSVSTYYKELDYLKELLSDNRNIKGCMIWAMTGFSNSEWEDKENDLEKAWCDSLKELAKRIATKRVCIISSELNQLLQEDEEYFEIQLKDWKENEKNPELIKTKNLKSFFDYISTYYGKDAKQYKVENFCLNDNSRKYSELVQEKGFFGIELSDEKKLVIKGEAVNPSTGLQGSYVFDENVIKHLYDMHKTVCSSQKTLVEFIEQKQYSNFLAFCKKQNLFLE